MITALLMNEPILLGTACTAAFAALVYAAHRRRRSKRIQIPFPEGWRQLLRRTVPLYRRLPGTLRLRLEPLVRELLLDVEFIGCRGLTVTEEMRLRIATQACLLAAGHRSGGFPLLRSILLYPDEFVVEERDEDEAGVVTEGTRALSGQSFATSRIVLSWKDVQQSGRAGEAYNVVLHEFAHHLDHSVGGLLTSPSKHRSLKRWHSVLEREYGALCIAVERGEPTLIDPYGAEHLEEFFAVATETFFEQPRAMQLQHAHLYSELRAFYALDPASWPPDGSSI